MSFNAPKYLLTLFYFPGSIYSKETTPESHMNGLLIGKANSRQGRIYSKETPPESHKGRVAYEQGLLRAGSALAKARFMQGRKYSKETPLE